MLSFTELKNNAGKSYMFQYDFYGRKEFLGILDSVEIRKDFYGSTYARCVFRTGYDERKTMEVYRHHLEHIIKLM